MPEHKVPLADFEYFAKKADHALYIGDNLEARKQVKRLLLLIQCEIQFQEERKSHDEDDNG